MPALARQGNHGDTADMSHFEAMKFFLIGLTGLAKDALHIYVALALFLGSCLIFGWKTRQWRPWLLVLFAAIVGEVWDLQTALENSQKIRLWQNWQDIWNTMLVPTVLIIVSRYSTIFSQKPPSPAVAKPKESSDQP